MRYDERYDRGFRGYDRPGPERRPRGYAPDYRRGPGRGYGYGPGYPASFADPSFAMGPGFMPVGWGWFGPMGMDPAPFAWGPPAGYGPRPPRRPEESPAYGRGGDRELQRWARERGYDVGYAIYPRGPRRQR